MRHFVFIQFFLLLTTLQLGCSGNHVPPPAAEGALAVEALTTALESWRTGAIDDSLRSRSPSIHVADDDWHAGRQLVGFQLFNETLDVSATAARIQAYLDLSGPTGTQRKVVQFLVSTSPSISVVRFDDEPQ